MILLFDSCVRGVELMDHGTHIYMRIRSHTYLRQPNWLKSQTHLLTSTQLAEESNALTSLPIRIFFIYYSLHTFYISFWIQKIINR